MSDRPVLYLIDGHAVAYRQFFALPEATFSTKNGEITNAIFGFTRILVDILLNARPKYLAVSFDMGLSGREETYAEYKSNREEMPDSLRKQLKRIEDVVSAFNIPILKLEGHEADDVIGTIAKQAEAQDVAVHIITGDRDILQLLSDHVRVQLPAFRSKPDVVYDIPKFIEKYQIRPDQLVDLKALMGDSSDNIPGVKGIGEKTGTKLLLKYETLAGIYENLADLKGATLKKLTEGKDLAFMSQNLAQIRFDLPVTLNLEECVTQDFDFNQVAPLFRELEFRSLFDRLESYNMTQLPLFGSGEVEEVTFLGEAAVAQEVVIVRDKDGLDAVVEALNNAEAIVWDVETTSVDQMAAKLVGIALAVDDKIGYYIPVGHDDGQQIAIEFVLDALEIPMMNPDIPKYAHNALYDLIVMQRYGIDVQPIAFDTMLSEWVRDPISKFLGLKNFTRQYLMKSMLDIDQLIGKGKDQRTMNEVDIDFAAPYAADDAVATFKAAQFLHEKMPEDENEHPVAEGKLSSLEIVEQIEMPVVPVIAAMQRKGVVLDTGYLSRMSDSLATDIQQLEQTIFELGESGTFNINSPKQLNDVLFDKLQLPVEGLNKTTHGYSTNVTTLERLQNDTGHPIIAHLLDYRELTKLKSTYVDALPELVNPHTGRVHTSYNQTGTSTGRFSSSNPNLQNIPIRTEQGRAVRRAFVAPEGYKLLAVDYSQIELRVMAHISEDKTLRQAFAEGQDIHKATAAAVYDVAPDDVTYEMRSFAKRVNFGLMYGMGAFRLARDSELTLQEADQFIKTYFERLPGVERYIKETEAFARKYGYVETLLGRRRPFLSLKKGGADRRAGAEIRAAINMPIQGTASDILKIAMVNLYAELNARQVDAHMILQVHDELVLEVADDVLDETTSLVVETMQNAYALSVPLVANAQIGQNWLDMDDVST